MAHYPQKLCDKTFQNYIKEGLALLFTKEGLEDFVLDVIRRQKDDILQDIYSKHGVPQGDICTSCITAIVIPCPTTAICKRNRPGCSYHRQNTPTQCKKNICHFFRDQIRLDHEFGRPSWKNTDSRQWCVDPYSIAKCYMPPDGYQNVNTLQETDFNGIISVIINNMCFDINKISTQTKNNLEQVRDIGKKHRHSSDFSVQDSDLTTNIDALIALLSDHVCLISNPKAQGAVQTLQQIKSNSLTITPQDITRVLEEVIESKTKDGKDQIDKHAESKIKDAEEEIVKHTEDKTRDAKSEIAKHVESKTKEAFLEIDRHVESNKTDTKEEIDKHAEFKSKITFKEINEHASCKSKDFKEEIDMHTKSKTKEVIENVDKYVERKTKEVDLEIDGQAERKTKNAKEEIDQHAESKTKDTREAIDKHAESRTKEAELDMNDYAERKIKGAKEDIEKYAESKIRDTKEALNKLNKHADSRIKEVELEIDGHAESITKHANEEINKYAESKIKEIAEEIDRLARRKTKEVVEEIRHQTQTAKEEIDENKQPVINELQRMKILISEMSKHEISEIFHRRTEALDLQRHLLELYTQSPYYLKTEVSPFLPEEEDYLDDFFVQPKMTRKIKTIPNEEKPVRTVEDFFTDGKTRFKNIVMVAGPGIGKTTMCKRIISLWCEAHQCSDVKYAVREYENKHKDIKTMKRIKFLFHVSLPHSMPDAHTIEQMIRQQLLNESHYDVLNTVLENEPENCLVVLDGLDEWTKPKITPSSPGVPPPQPDREVKSPYSTILVTRPFKLEKTGPFAIDVQINLHALDKQGIQKHVQSILAKLDKDGSINSTEFFKEITKMNIASLLEVPLLLKMIICLCYDEKTIHETFTGIYICITESLLDRASQKMLRSDIKQNKSPDVTLPDCFNEQTNCKEMTDILLQLSAFAFDLLFKQGKKCVFTMKSSDSQFPGLAQCLEIGLLSKTPLSGLSARHRYTSVSFIHETFQEFFSALFISVFENDDNMKLLFQTCNTLDSFLALNRFFTFVSEMNPQLLTKICEHVADIVDCYPPVLDFRNMQCPTFLWPYLNDSLTDMFEQVQAVIKNCIEQTLNIKHFHVEVNIRDVFIDTSKDMFAPVDNIFPDSVTSLHVCHTEEIAKEAVEFLHACSMVRCIWYYKPSCLVKWHDIFPGDNAFEKYSCLETLYLRKCDIGHTQITAIVLHPNMKNVYFSEIRSRKDSMCPCSIQLVRTAESERKAETRVKTLCIVKSSGVLTHIEAAPNLQTLVWDHSEPCFSTAEKISNFLSTSCNLQTVRIKGLKRMTLSADKNAIVDRICEELSGLRLDTCELQDSILSSRQDSKIKALYARIHQAKDD